jgi:DNA-directed RNA polymerase-5 subunit 1
MSIPVMDYSLTQMPTDGKLHIVPHVQFSFSDANTVLSESIEGTVKVIANSVGPGFLPNVTQKDSLIQRHIGVQLVFPRVLRVV